MTFTEILKKARDLNWAKDFRETIDSLTAAVFTEHRDNSLIAELYVEKAVALNGSKKYKEATALVGPSMLEVLNSDKLYAEISQAYYRIKKYQESITAAQKALAINPRNAKAITYNGADFRFKDKPDDAIGIFEDAKKLDPSLALPFNAVSQVYVDKAQRVASEDGSEILRKMQTPKKVRDVESGLRLFDNLMIPPFYNGSKKSESEKSRYEWYKMAIEENQMAIKIDPDYEQAYNTRGIALFAVKDLDGALKDFNKAIDIDEGYPSPYFNRGLLFEKKKFYSRALDDFRKYLDMSVDEPNSVKMRIARKLKDRLEKIVKLDLYRKIIDVTVRIKELLRFNDVEITHYTKFCTAQQIFLHDSKFRLSEASFLNDPNEGKTLIKHLKSTENKRMFEDVAMNSFAAKPFIGSFVLKDKYDDLRLWRTYGRNNVDDANGCSITFNCNKLLDCVKSELSKNGKDLELSIKESGDDLYFYKVAYKRENENEFVVPDLSENARMNAVELNKEIGKLKELVAAFYAKIEKYPQSERYEWQTNLLELLNEISYLFKSGEHEYESEIRIVIRTERSLNKFIVDDGGLPKTYVELGSIAPAITKLTLGPKVRQPEEWAAAFHHVLDKKGYKPAILTSKLPYK